jgi:hypothetical protein
VIPKTPSAHNRDLEPDRTRLGFVVAADQDLVNGEVLTTARAVGATMIVMVKNGHGAAFTAVAERHGVSP